MRYISLTLLFVLFGFLISPAQDLQVTQINEKMSQGSHTGLKVLVYQASVDEVEDEWDKKIRRDFNANTNNKGGEIVAEDAENEDINPTTMYIYSKVEESDQGAVLKVFVNLGGAYLNSSDHQDGFEKMREIMKEFSREIAAEALEDKLDEHEDQLKDMRKNYQDLVSEKNDLNNDIEGHEKDIEDCKETIEEAKKEIKKAEKEVEKTKKKMEEKQAKVEEQEEKVEKVEKQLKKVD